jgi:peptidoglycan/LPS O-acetylase OafA/YrhL
MPADLKALTSLRFFAAMWVTLFHYWPTLGAPMPALVGRGNLGVELFFVLSGFILSHVYLDQAGSGRLRFGAFLWARLSRIYPVHLATLIGVGLLGAAALAFGITTEHPVVVWSVLPQNLLLLHAWGTANAAAWNHPSWSISAEWFAYVLFPLFAWATWRLRKRPLLALAGAATFIGIIYPAFQRVMGFPLSEATIAWGALRIVPCFALGCATNLVWRSNAITRKSMAVSVSAAALGAIALAGVVAAPDEVFVLLFGLLILALASLASTGSKLLTAAPLVYLGEVSFAIYMVAIPWQLVVSKLAQRLGVPSDHFPLWLWIIQLIGVVAVAALTHHVIERPFRTLMRRHDPFAEQRPHPMPEMISRAA